MVARRGLEGRVRFVGDVDEGALAELYGAADVFVLPSTQRSEAYGLVLLEAMAAGRPVISTELGTGTSWVNQDGVTGIVVKPGSASELAHALNRLLADPSLRERFGRAGQARVEAELCEERMVEAVAEVYRNVLG
jgi:rhamnosyl/mannosyltransferase